MRQEVGGCSQKRTLLVMSMRTLGKLPHTRRVIRIIGCMTDSVRTPVRLALSCEDGAPEPSAHPYRRRRNIAGLTDGMTPPLLQKFSCHRFTLWRYIGEPSCRGAICLLMGDPQDENYGYQELGITGGQGSALWEIPRCPGFFC